MPKEPDRPLRSISKQSKLVKKKTKYDMISNASIKEGIAAETGLDLDTTKDDDKDNSKDETMEHTSAYEEVEEYQPSQPLPRSAIALANDRAPIISRNLSTNETIETEVRHVIIKSADIHNKMCLVELDPYTVADEIESFVNEYKQCKPIKSGGLLVEVDTLDKIRILLSLEVFCGHNVEVELAKYIGTVRGVIYDRRLVNKSE